MTASVGTVAPTTAYRHDIDGLRAIAILLVVAFHTGWNRLSGGYVGVDVFFVLSGFLITGLLLREHRATGSIDLRRFYARRIRRLLPLSALVLVATTVAGLVLLPPLHRTELLRDARAAGLYLANWRYSFQATAYSDAEVTDSLLLHFWSLSIEEQYYLIWPLLIVLAGWIAVRRGLGNVEPVAVSILAIVVAVSLASSVLLTEQLGPAAYYVTYTRFWEMGVGALLAFFLPRLGPLRRDVGDLLCVTGLVAIGLTAIGLDAESPFPGTLAVIPVAGTVAILVGAVTPGSRVAALLSLRPARMLGRWSYAWYLWHWPVIGIALMSNERLDEPLGRRPTVVAAVLISLLLAGLSHRWFETPLRHHPWLARGNRPSLAIGALLTLVPAVLASTVLLGGMLAGVVIAPMPDGATAAEPGGNDGYGVEAAPMRPAEAAEDDLGPGMLDCHVRQRDPDVATGPGCVLGDPDGRATVVVTGDSHAMHWLPALHLAGQIEGVRIVPHTKSSCVPWDVEIVNANFNRVYTECSEWRQAMLDDVARRYGTVDAVIIARSEGYRDLVVAAGEAPDGEAHVRRLWRSGAQRSLTAWGSVADRVIVLRDTPWADDDIPACLSVHHREPARCNLTLSDATGGDAHQYVAEWAAARTLERDQDVAVEMHFADPTPLVCRREDCPMVTPDGLIKYRDRHHLTATYARSIAHEFWQLLPLPVFSASGR